MSEIKYNIEDKVVNQHCWKSVRFNVIRYTPKNIQEKLEGNVYSLIWRNVFGIVEETVANNILEVMKQNCYSGKYIYYYNKYNILKAFK